MRKNQEKLISKSNEFDISEDSLVKVVIQNNKYANATYLVKKLKPKIKKISKSEYVNLDTGEIGFYKLNDKKQNLESIRKSFTKLVYLIRHNFTSKSKKQLFITLTYSENMTDKDKLYKDFEKFYKRLKYKFKEIKFDYILVAEPQDRGAWHIHLMLKGDKPLYISDSVIRQLWGHGLTQTERLKSDDVGKYYVAYFTNLELEGKNLKDKKYIKGARLLLYPSGMKLYRTTRGIEKPVEVQMSWKDLKDQFGSPVWFQKYDVSKLKEGRKKKVNSIYKASFEK